MHNLGSSASKGIQCKGVRETFAFHLFLVAVVLNFSAGSPVEPDADSELWHADVQDETYSMNFSLLQQSLALQRLEVGTQSPEGIASSLLLAVSQQQNSAATVGIACGIVFAIIVLVCLAPFNSGSSFWMSWHTPSQAKGTEGKEQPFPSAIPMEDEAEMLDFMARVAAFRQIPREERLSLACAFRPRRVKPSEQIVAQGEPGSELFFIRSGSVSVKVKSEDGQNEELALLQAGQHFGEVALLTAEPRNASVYAVEPTELSVLSRDEFEQHGLRSKMVLEMKRARLERGLLFAFTSTFSLRSLLTLVMVLLLYISLSCLVFMHLEGWSLHDAIYFSVVTLSTVGFGDFAPKSVPGRLLTILFIIMALVFVATAIGNFLQHLVDLEIQYEKEKRAMLLQDPRAASLLASDDQTAQWRWEFFACLMGILVVAGIAAIASKLMMDDVKDWADAFYFSVITLTTVGYGDIVPHKESSKWFVTILCLFGVPIFTMSLAKVVELSYGHARSKQMTSVSQLRADKFQEILEFRRELKKAGLSIDDSQEECSQLDFLCFVLTKNGNVSIDDIKAIATNFNELDRDGSGALDSADLIR